MSSLVSRKFATASVFCLLFLFGISPLHADSFTFVGTTSGGNTVDATAILVGSPGSNTLTITLRNNLTDIVSVGQGISGLSFQIVDSSGNVVAITPVSITSQFGREVSFNGTTTGTDAGGSSAVDTMHWGMSTQDPAYMNALGFTGASNPPDEVILGLPSSSTSTTATYSSANSSITSNDPHQPLVVYEATFTVTLGTNLPTGFQFSNVNMFFGTNPDTFGCSGSCTPTATPEPGSLLLLGTGLSGLALLRRKRQSR
jgi:PEP-CTERM motif